MGQTPEGTKRRRLLSWSRQALPGRSQRRRERLRTHGREAPQYNILRDPAVPGLDKYRGKATFRRFDHAASWRFAVTFMKDGQGDGASLHMLSQIRPNEP